MAIFVVASYLLMPVVLHHNIYMTESLQAGLDRPQYGSACSSGGNIAASETVKLDANTDLELVLIPAGEYIMGTEKPRNPDVGAFRSKIIIGQAIMSCSMAIFAVFVGTVIIRTLRARSRFQYGLARFMAMMWVLGIGVWGGTLWFEASRDIKCIQDEYAAALARYTPGELDKPAHKVTIPRPFYMSRYEVTAGQYRAIVPGLRYTTISSSHPVEGVTWGEAKRFCTLLENRLGRKVRLPTEAEWEYACRANTKTTLYCGDDFKALDGVAWYISNSGATTHAVGGKMPNAFNLFDMHGNALEWVEDDFHVNYIGAPIDGSAWIDKPRANSRVVRGGCWYDYGMACGSAYRDGRHAQDAFLWPVGFRVVIEMR